MKYLRITATVSMMALSACSSGTVRDTLGLSSPSPDEYRVVSRPPLSVPPQFNLLPPSATAQSPNMLPADKQAQSLITGNDASRASAQTLKPGTADTAVIPVTTGSASTSAESAFLKSAGADKADPTVRDHLVEEHIVQQDKKQESSWWDVMSSDTAPKETIVDANKESQRIKTDTDAGKPVTEGDTAVVKQKDTGVLGQIFGY